MEFLGSLLGTLLKEKSSFTNVNIYVLLHLHKILSNCLEHGVTVIKFSCAFNCCKGAHTKPLTKTSKE
jgi:hypothetical protein